MIRSMGLVWAAWVALGMSVAGCGAGSTANSRVAPKISSSPPSAATVGVPFDYTVTADGMTPMTFAVVTGPNGFTIHSGSGVVTWTPEVEGRVSIELSATNLADSDTQAFDVEVQALTGPVFTTEAPTEATVGAAYAYDPSVAARGEVVWSAPVSPDGLTIDPDTGAVRWTPSSNQVGPQDVTLRATEVAGGLFADQAFVVTVQDTGGPAVITSMPPERIFAGEVLRYRATASGAPVIQWSLEPPSTGTAASGVVIVTSPPEGSEVMVEWDASLVSPGDYSIALRVDNGLGDADVQEFAVTVDPRPPVPEIDLVTAPPPATVFVGSTYGYDLGLSPGTESVGVTWSLVGATVPPDLAITIDPGTGVVSFTASDANGEIRYTYTARAENVLGEGDEATIAVDAVYPPATPMITVTPGSVFNLQVGESFPGASATTTGHPTPVLSVSGTVPPFMEFDPLTGLLSASSVQPVPIDADIGTHSFDIVATNSEGVDSATIDVTVMAAPPRIDSITPAAGRRQSDVPIIVRGAGFVSAATPVIRVELGAYQETLATTYVDAGTLTAVVPIDLARPSGVYDVVVDQGSASTLSKRFTVTEGAGTVLSGSIGVDTTLRAIDNPYVIAGDVQIENGATVTLEPGVVVMLAGDTNRRIDVGVNGAGAVFADGGVPGVGDQIVFTRFQEIAGPAPVGHFQGLRFGSNVVSTQTALQNVIVEFGGRVNADADRGAIEVLSGSAPEIGSSIIRESLNYGLYAQSGAGSDTRDWFHDNQLTSNGRAPISVGSNEVSTLGGNLRLTGNGQDRIFVRGSSVDRPTANWSNYGVPFYLDNGLMVRRGSVMTIAAGTEMRFRSGQRFQVATSSEDGALVAVGTPEAPIRMLADAGTWNGIRFDDRVLTGTVLRNVRVEDFGASVSAGLRVANPVRPGNRVAIVENCLFASGEADAIGVRLADDAGMRSFENNVMDVDGFSVSARLAGFADLVGVSNVYEAPLRVRSGTVSGASQVWSRPLASDSSTQAIKPTGNLAVTNGSLTIAAGTRIEMPINGELAITDAQLLIEGTAADPVVITPAPGVAYWNRIRLHGAGRAGVSRIVHAVIEAAGSDPVLAARTDRAAVVVEPNGGTSATPVISNTTIMDSNGYGVTFADSTHCAGMCEGNTIKGSRFSAVRMYANFVGRFGTGNALSRNNTSGTLGHEGVWVVGDTIDTTAIWPANDVPYLIQGDIELRQSSPLVPVPVWTIEPGSELRISDNGRIRVGEGNDGILEARGSRSAPIRFTSIDPSAPAFWRGIDFNQGSDGSTLDWVVLTHGGRDANTGNINIRMGSVVSIGVATFQLSGNYAAVIESGSAPMFTGPPSDRIYSLNGQSSNPGVGDSAFDCVRDLATSACTQF